MTDFRKRVIQRWRTSGPPPRLRWALAAACVLLAFGWQWLLLSGGWSGAAQVGGPNDSPWLVDGFYPKERSADFPFRWLESQASVVLPHTHRQYVVELTAAWGPDAPAEPATLAEQGQLFATVPLDAAMRTYRVFWAPAATRQLWRLDSAAALDFYAATRHPAGDERLLSFVLTRIGAATAGPISLTPLLWCALCVALALVLLAPRRWSGWTLALALALALPPLLTWLAWTPASSPWRPWAALPALLALALLGALVARWPWHSRWAWLPAALVLLTLAALMVGIGRQWSVTGPDFEWHSNHGYDAASVFRAHNFYPLGFPLILWLGKFSGNDLLVGRIASGIALFGASGATVALAWRISGWRAALTTAVLLLGSPVWVAFGIVASTDAVQLLPLMLALLILGWQRRISTRRALAAGLALGISYLFRHQSLIYTLMICAWLLLNPVAAPERWRANWLGRRLPALFGCLVLLGGFGLGSAPQWILDIRDTGRPFYSKQYENIWLAAYNRTDPVVDRTTGESSPNTGMLDIVAFDPYQLGRHWSANLREFGSATLPQLFVWPLVLLVALGLALAILQPGDPRIKALLAIAVMYVPVIALIWNKDRFYLPIVPLLAILGAWGLEQCWARQWAWRRWSINLGAVLLAGLVAWTLRHLGAVESILAIYGNLDSRF